jgi:hypothetical protein
MTHLCWYYLGRDVKVAPTIPVFVMTGEGEWTRNYPPRTDRRAKAVCNRNVPASEITTEISKCECAECIKVHKRDVDPG